MAKEYVERKAAINACFDGWNNNAHDCAENIRLIPAADVRPVVRGKWIKRMEEKKTPYYKSFTPVWSCSECETEYDPSICMTINFCPNCGALMEVSKE